MEAHTDTTSVVKAWQTTAIVAGAMAASVLVFNVLAFVLMRQNPEFRVPVDLALASYGLSNTTLYYVLYGVVLALIVAARLIYRISFLGLAPTERAAALAKLRNTHLLLAALAEAACIVGFLLFILLHLYRDFLIFSVASLLLHCVQFPRKSAWERYLTRAA